MKIKLFSNLIHCTLLAISLLIVFPGKSQNYDMKFHTWTATPSYTKPSSEVEKDPYFYAKDLRVNEYVFEGEEFFHVYTRHLIIHVNNDIGVESYNTYYIQAADTSLILSFKARVYDASNKVVEMTKKDLKIGEEDGVSYIKLAVKGMAPGKELELIYTLRYGNSTYGSEYIQTTADAYNVEYRIVSPEHLIMKTKSYNGFPELVANPDSTKKDKNRYIGKIDHINAQKKDEKYSEYVANLMRVEYKLWKNTVKGLNNLSSWADLGQQYFKALHYQEESASKTIKKLASKLDLNGKSSEEKIRKIENFIKTNIQMEEQLPESTIEQTLKNKYGNLVSVLQLYVLLLDESEVKYELVFTSDRTKQPFDPDFESPSFLDNYLLFFPESGKYIAPFNMLMRLGLFPESLAYSQGLFIKSIKLGETRSAVCSIKKINGLTAEQNFNDLTIVANLDPKMEKIEFDFTHSLGGMESLQLRPYYFFLEGEKRKELVDESIKSYYKDAEIKDPKVENYDLEKTSMEQPCVLSAHLTVKQMVETAGNTYLVKFGDLIGPQAEMYDESERINPVFYGNAHQYHRVITFKIPSGYTVKGTDKLKMNVVLQENNQNLAGFESSFTQSDTEIKVDVMEYYRQSEFRKDQYPQFKNVINAAADFNKIVLVLEKK